MLIRTTGFYNKKEKRKDKECFPIQIFLMSLLDKVIRNSIEHVSLPIWSNIQNEFAMRKHFYNIILYLIHS
uniref:Uncharacterized protein n=1 Tax=Octopus bimaculoides TaxID=37653 RepID=A0A0L8FP30_OCTBM